MFKKKRKKKYLMPSSQSKWATLGLHRNMREECGICGECFRQLFDESNPHPKYVK